MTIIGIDLGSPRLKGVENISPRLQEGVNMFNSLFLLYVNTLWPPLCFLTLRFFIASHHFDLTALNMCYKSSCTNGLMQFSVALLSN